MERNLVLQGTEYYCFLQRFRSIWAYILIHPANLCDRVSEVTASPLYLTSCKPRSCGSHGQGSSQVLEMGVASSRAIASVWALVLLSRRKCRSSQRGDQLELPPFTKFPAYGKLLCRLTVLLQMLVHVSLADGPSSDNCLVGSVLTECSAHIQVIMVWWWNDP